MIRLTKLIKENISKSKISEAWAEDSDTGELFKTYKDAIAAGIKDAKRRGYEIDKDDYEREIVKGPKTIKPYKRKVITLGLKKNGKPVKKQLFIEIYATENKFELVGANIF